MKTNRIYYAAYNRYGTLTSQGFSNTYEIVGFENKSDRDEFVHVASEYNSNVRSISKRDIGQYIDRPRPFRNEAWRLMRIEPMELITNKINDEFSPTDKMFMIIVSGDDSIQKVYQ